jgi:hypothetical protein
MLGEFLRTWEIDILLVQEVRHHVLHDLKGYTTQYCNEIRVIDLCFWLYCKRNMDFNVRFI